MTNSKLLVHSLGHAILMMIYASGVAWIMFNGNRLFGGKDTILTSISVLMLFVVSAAITGSLVLGRPIILYLDGQKRDALKMFAFTLGWLVLGTIVFFILNLKIFKN